jgi:hypothetical protein
MRAGIFVIYVRNLGALQLPVDLAVHFNQKIFLAAINPNFRQIARFFRGFGMDQQIMLRAGKAFGSENSFALRCAGQFRAFTASQ